MNKHRNDDDYTISEREKRAWRSGKNRSHKRPRPVLSDADLIIFLKLVAQMAGYSTFERKLGLDRSDVDHYKAELNVETPDEARRLSSIISQQITEAAEASAIMQEAKAREAERVANERLKEIELKKLSDMQDRKSQLDANAIREEDAKRQRQFANEQAAASVPEQDWRLRFNGGRADRDEQIEKFRRDIVYRGMRFCMKKYDASWTQIRHEADRLGLDINWDLIRR